MTYFDLMGDLDKIYKKALKEDNDELASKANNLSKVLFDNDFLFDGREVPTDIVNIVVHLLL
jgi:hypothetical protein